MATKETKFEEKIKELEQIINELENGNIDLEITKLSLDKLKVDSLGLDETDYQLLKTIALKFNGGPVGIESLASIIGEEVSTLEDVCEPFLLQRGLLKRTPRGRMLTDLGYQHLNMNKQGTLFDFEV